MWISHEEKKKKLPLLYYLHKSCCFVKKHCHVPILNLVLTTRSLDTNAQNFIAVKTAVQDSQIVVSEVMKDKITSFIRQMTLW